jgi:two-component system NtrC family sensor kinase
MARQQPPERVPVHLNELINAALDLVSYSLRTAGITVRLDLASDLPPLLADAAQLQQVFSNLFVNAQSQRETRC